MHKFRKQKLTFSGTCSNRAIAAKIGLVVPGKYVARSESEKMARMLSKEMKEKYSHFEWRFPKNDEAQICKLPLDTNIAFS